MEEVKKPSDCEEVKKENAELKEKNAVLTAENKKVKEDLATITYDMNVIGDITKKY
jgi:regulator of replication initiation timing